MPLYFVSYFDPWTEQPLCCLVEEHPLAWYTRAVVAAGCVNGKVLSLLWWTQLGAADLGGVEAFQRFREGV